MTYYYFVYQTTNNINGKYYRGAHQTKNLDDGYLGSGTRLKRAIKKYGVENFTREILCFCENEEQMYLKENELVIISKDTYNILEGGHGGFSHINKNGLHPDRSEIGKLGGKASHVSIKQKRQANTIYNEQYVNYMSGWAEKGRAAQKIKYPEGVWKGKTHTEETKKKIGEKTKITQLGSNNSQYGTCWITNGQENKKIKKEDLDIWVKKGYNKGRI